jgi:NAD(P)-dependent dehydrogenase (short-subunit alcohol dehydrogenase family)
MTRIAPAPTSGAQSRPGRLEGLNVFITGASRGIGRSVALTMAQEGARLTLAATSAQSLDNVLAQCAPAASGSHRVQLLDVADRAACFAAILESRAAQGSVDVLVNGAGIYLARSFLDHSEADFQRLIDVNLLGTMHLMQAALPEMMEKRSGRVINIASAAGKWASPNQSGYNISKHAVIGLTRCVALEMGAFGVTVNAICPGLVETDMLRTSYGRTTQHAGSSLDEVLAPVLSRVAMRRALQPEEIATLAVFLASAESSGMTGQSLSIDGGMLYT